MENMTAINPAVTEIAANSSSTWTAEQEAAFASIMRMRRCSRIQAIHLYKRGNPDGILPHFSRSRTEPTERMEQFATENRLRLVDTGAERVVPGKYGQIADMGDDGFLRLRLLAVPRGANVDRTLRARRAQALAGGLTWRWKGDTESILTFDPANEAQVQLAVKLVGAKRKRTMSVEQRQAGAARLAAARSSRLPRAA